MIVEELYIPEETKYEKCYTNFEKQSYKEHYHRIVIK